MTQALNFFSKMHAFAVLGITNQRTERLGKSNETCESPRESHLLQSMAFFIPSIDAFHVREPLCHNDYVEPG